MKKRIYRKQTKGDQVLKPSTENIIEEALDLLRLCGESCFMQLEMQTRTILEEERSRQISFGTDRRLYQYSFRSNRKAPWNI